MGYAYVTSRIIRCSYFEHLVFYQMLFFVAVALCHMLAFYCRGDMEQMDRLFRKSGLMRDKWDRPQSGSTYGRLTMKKAISGCTSFYGQEDKSSATDDFEEISDSDDETVISAYVDSCSSAEDGTDDDNEDTADSIADTNRSMIGSYLSNPPLSVETALSDNFLTLAAWAAQNDLLYYTRMRDAVPKNIGMRNFEREVRKRQRALNAAVHSSTLALLSLKGINTPGMLVPEGWTVNDHGITHLEMMFGELRPVPISAEPRVGRRKRFCSGNCRTKYCLMRKRNEAGTDI